MKGIRAFLAPQTSGRRRPALVAAGSRLAL